MKSYFFLSLCLLFAFSCTKPKNAENTEPELPPLTTKGKNVMGCKVNGAIQVYSGKGTFSNASGVSYYNYADKIKILCSKLDNLGGQDILLVIYKPAEVGSTYLFSSESADNYADYSLSSPSLTGDYYTGSGWIKFARLDNEVAAGTFEFTAYRGDDSVVITDGRFDISE